MPRGTKELPTAFTQAVHAEINELMRQRGISQRKLEELSGVKQPRLSQTIGKNARSLDLTELDRICEALGASPEAVVATAERVLQARSAYALAAKEAPAPATDINEEDYL
ncbi:helix-turn-helix domain-containing protein [Rothia terrae]|uniref:helix-turn-helix domain-containing protein n=1 Tax=Rothia terrae TaxID=396015 RepID=UPI00382003CA